MNKYRNVKGFSHLLKRTFDSLGEMRYAEHLHFRQLAGDISDLQFQVRWDCEVAGRRIGGRYMRIDFKYYDKHLDEWVWDDFKGPVTKDWAVKRDIWAAGGPGTLRITKKGTKGHPFPGTYLRPPQEGIE